MYTFLVFLFTGILFAQAIYSIALYEMLVKNNRLDPVIAKRRKIRILLRTVAFTGLFVYLGFKMNY